MKTLAGPAAFTVLVVALFVGIGELVTRISGESERARRAIAASGEVSPEAGEAIFWGRGKCGTCHAVSGRGNAVRGPDQGERGPLGLPIARRAEARARERARASGRPYTPTDYLVESLVAPGAYVVSGFKNEMPNPLEPPISLTPDEVRAVVLYLQTLGGTADASAIRLPERARAATAAAPRDAALLAAGDPARGRALFFDEGGSAACGTCHRAGDRGGTVGPELTHVAGTRDIAFILDSILAPAKVIASGYETVRVVTHRGQILTGIPRDESPDELVLVDTQGRAQKIRKADIAKRAAQTTSLMPENFRDILTVAELQDLLAFLLTLR
ncbi:MAG: c-type cytochrome [Candidatus Rokubacteria bacterium]|nr:c-type cytochrome [Candidatus Rokubacteria bacterium]